ncbi:hypothetical protein BEL04_17390 [Mucilaginibacter sp. PPCGB 2223]|uniref:hypothetical protein n=1 Tax=Mucilaginibacter sp. PPCGB 2223 TaxID=1886027 RepID=UPI0008241144|nr:hypothetical protein [Mucilaginibacter sp. PPCGB 2223]OCX51786.1 hypothetical protein BEL04_17390 [Mucilaginibacter sp. PPCGB 2223]
MAIVNLLDYKEDIKNFILSTFDKFSEEQYRPYVMGIYSCPWSGWVSLHFNITKDAPMDSCVDFEFVEYGFISFEEWEENTMIFGDSEWQDANGKLLLRKWGDGDEILNKLFFDFLKLIVSEIKQIKILPFVFIQMLDSAYSELIK